MLINDLVAAMQNKDHRALAACFDEECLLFDYCPSQVKQQNSFVFGRNAIEMAFHNKFMFGGFDLRHAHVLDESRLDLYVGYHGTSVHALAQVESRAENAGDTEGLIKELVIRPA